MRPAVEQAYVVRQPSWENRSFDRTDDAPAKCLDASTRLRNELVWCLMSSPAQFEVPCPGRLTCVESFVVTKQRIASPRSETNANCSVQLTAARDQRDLFLVVYQRDLQVISAFICNMNCRSESAHDNAEMCRLECMYTVQYCSFQVATA